MDRKIRLLSTDFDGTLVAHDNDPVLDPACIELIGQLQRDGALWTINTGRSVELLESGLLDFEFPIRPDFCDDILHGSCSPSGIIALSINLRARGFLMSTLEESCQEVVLAWTPSVVFLFIVLLRDWLYRRRRGISELAKTAHDGA